ncbi:glycoside hydrolase family 55 protein [Hydnomerulius pinastri MD-312]|uniref:Unplaced genomic scaffold scaffold_37, whole genome shotgun sequence n=1 Tax=Hydnomerulius pinastri MD-312 TaxID=994086 RepID=A0A0C9VRR3_9AGAM|nr:glycoside hydrolase family 55 protein [Hydnomerulius pinastri MD-312]
MFGQSRLSLLFASIGVLLVPFASGLGSSCPSASTVGLAAPDDPYWMQTIKHQGTSAFNPEASYQVFRNVKDFGAKGDGVTDDTDAINAAMSEGDRCGQGCESSTLTPAIVYFPPGKYVVSSAINTYYYTQMIGDAKRPPTLLASPDFSGLAVIDADPYIPGGAGAQWFINQDNFYRSVRNIIIDLRQMPVTAPAIGLHWQVSQSTSLMNVIVEMSQENGTQHQGLFMENGSGGFMGDITFNGGKTGISVGNQQFTVRNLTVNNAVVAVAAAWSWGWTYQGVSINNCQVGFSLTTGGTTSATQSVGSEAIIDATVMNTGVFISTSKPSNGTLAGSLVLNNIMLHNVPVAVGVQAGEVVLHGSKDSTWIDSWGQGNVYVGTSGQPQFTQGPITPPQKPWNVIDSTGKIFGKSHPQYADYALEQIVSVKSHGAVGDGVTDDTEALQKIFDQYAGCKLIFFDAGTYYITDTLVIPAGSQVAGEAWSVILGGGPKFQDEANPRVMVRAGERYSTGILEINDIIFSTVGPAPGAIIIEWNVHEPWDVQGGAGMWDSYIRLGGAAGTNLQISQCPAGTLSSECKAAFMGMHLTSGSSAYLEGTWIWTADHDLDTPESDQISIFTGRGILSESLGPVWMIGTAEHAALYQYNLHNAQNHWIGFAQTETPYYQPVPGAPAPYSIDKAYFDPEFDSSNAMAWALYVQTSWDITLFGAGFYSFFQNYTQDCLATFSCQSQILNIDKDSTIQVYSLSTVGTTYQLSLSHNGIIDESNNRDGFQETLTSWTRW